jgi:uncharacterized Zn finger protein
MREKLFQALRDEKHLRALAGAKSYERGEGYSSQGAVRSLVTHAGKLAARVEGSEDYTVILWLEGSALRSSCSCPMGDMGEFCKHCVATALTYVDVISSPATDDTDDEADETDDDYYDEDDYERRHYGIKPKLQTLDDVQSYLAACRKEQLVELLLDIALQSDEWRACLKQKARERKR